MTYLLRLVVCLSLCVSLNSFGAILQTSTNGHLTGALQINVGGNLFDATFYFQNCQDIDNFNGCDQAEDFTFQDASIALLASQALNDQVLTGIFDDDPSLTAGCESLSSDILFNRQCFLYTPYDIDASNGWGSGPIRSAVAHNISSINAEDNSPGLSGFSYSSNFSSNSVLVYWEASQPSPVPLPAGIYLFLSGLVGLGLMRGRNA